MSRSGYSDDCDDQGRFNCYRGAVASALRGKRGQALLREALDALDAMPVKELVSESLVNAQGAVCMLGAVGAKRGIDMTHLDPENPRQVAKAFGIADAMVREIVFENDEGTWCGETDAQRWSRMRAWIAAQIIAPEPAS